MILWIYSEKRLTKHLII